MRADSVQKKTIFICGERHEKNNEKKLVHNSRSDGSACDDLRVLFLEMGAGTVSYTHLTLPTT